MPALRQQVCSTFVSPKLPVKKVGNYHTTSNWVQTEINAKTTIFPFGMWGKYPVYARADSSHGFVCCDQVAVLLPMGRVDMWHCFWSEKEFGAPLDIRVFLKGFGTWSPALLITKISFSWEPRDSFTRADMLGFGEELSSWSVKNARLIFPSLALVLGPISVKITQTPTLILNPRKTGSR